MSNVEQQLNQSLTPVFCSGLSGRLTAWRNALGRERRRIKSEINAVDGAGGG